MEEVRAKITHMLGKRGVFLDTLTDPASNNLPVSRTHVGAPQRAPSGNGTGFVTHGAFYRSGKIPASFTHGVESRHLQLFGGCLYTLIKNEPFKRFAVKYELIHTHGGKPTGSRLGL